LSRVTSEVATVSDRLLDILSAYPQILVVMHDNPDPDAIASGWAIRVLVEEGLGIPVRLVAGGAIVRAENRHLVELLSPPLELVSELDESVGAAAVLVDCGLGTTNHIATREGITPVAVIDHHVIGGETQGLPLADIRTDAAASASIAASYLRQQDIDPGMKLATAILYAIRSETSGGENNHSELDRSIIEWLTPWADPTLLAEIQNAPLDWDYFGDLVLAMQRTFVYGDVAFCYLPRAGAVEIVGEVADLLVRCRDIRRVLCAAVIDDELLLSARTEQSFDNAAELLQATLNGLGGCGGHAHRAGGKVPRVGQRIANDTQEELCRRWLSACGADRTRPRRLVPKQEIVQNL